MEFDAWGWDAPQSGSGGLRIADVSYRMAAALVGVAAASTGVAAAWVLLVAVLGVVPGVSSAQQASDLATRLDRASTRGVLRQARVGALVVRERDGAVLYARNANVALIPASNMKILTALTALEVFGPAHRFETIIQANTRPGLSGEVTDLAVLGGGDPVLNSEDWWRLAADLHRGGLRRVQGDILVDDSAFDAVFWHPDWGSVSSRAYHAPVGALTANYGAFFVAVRPGARSGDPVRVSVDPPVPYLQVSNLAVTGTQRSLSVHRAQKRGANDVVSVRGTVRVGDAEDVFPRSVSDPALYAGAVLKLQLEAVGIAVEGKVRRGQASLPVELLVFKGRPLSEIVRLFMKYSNNSIAEGLVKSLAVHSTGGAGNWPDGLAEMQRRLRARGLWSEGMVVVDGSGLSPHARVTPASLVEALREGGREFRLGPELVASLPIAGRDGTLEKRTRRSQGKVRAKTGLLSDQRVTALSGFAELADGELGVFSILVNRYAGGASGAMSAVDAWVAELAH
jgi:D-alanyl-D-alanine carboxypeptidase/D-alanyl-D-alanine-endopeptidase (penicillin-binding protein 4)